MRVTNGIPLGCPQPLTGHCCKLRPNTLKALGAAANWPSWTAGMKEMFPIHLETSVMGVDFGRTGDYNADAWYGARVEAWGLHSRTPLGLTPLLRLKC
jgi:hypothetical protein